MNTKVTLITVIVAAGLLLLALLTWNPGSSSTTESDGLDRTNLRLFEPGMFDPERVTSITLARPDDETYTFVKDDNTWTQTQPDTFQMQTFAIRRLATAAADLTVTRTIQPSEFTEDVSPAVLGFEPPLATLTYEMRAATSGEAEASAESSSMVVHLGKVFVGGNAYAQLDEDGPIYVVTDDLHDRALRDDLSGWRESRIFVEVDNEVSRIRYANKEDDQRVALQRIDQAWHLTAPVQARADNQAVSSLVNDLIMASLKGWVDHGSPADEVYGVSDPALTIALETDRTDESGAVFTDSVHLNMGNQVSLADATRYASVRGREHLFTIDGGTIRRLMPDFVTLVSRATVDVQAENVAAIGVDGPGGAFRLTRATEGGWNVEPSWEEATHPAQSALVETLLHRLTMEQQEVEVGSIRDEDRVAAVTLFGFDDAALSTVTIGAGDFDGEFRVLFDDGTSVVRYTPDVDLPDLEASAYMAEPAESDETVPVTPVDPDSVSK